MLRCIRWDGYVSGVRGDCNMMFDLAIVGMGPVGALAANLAGAAGLKTVVLERDEQPYRQPRAIVFDAEVMRIFASIGLADQIGAMTRPLGGSVYLGLDFQPIRIFRAHPRANDAAWHPSNLFYQPQLEALLRKGLDRFPNVTVLTEHEVTSVEARELVRLRTRASSGTETIVRARHVLACDGASSAIRKALDIPLDDIGFEERWLVVDTLVNGPMKWPEGYGIPPEVRSGEFSLMVCDPARPATLIPGSGRHRRWEYMLLADESDAEVVTDGWLRAQVGKWIDPGDVEFVRAAVYRFRALIAERWRAGNIFLLGDAAHQTPPFYGQGMCHGIRDAAQLIWRIALVQRGIAGDALLDSYQQEREPHVRAVVTASVAAGAEVCKLDPAEAEARDAAFRASEKIRGKRVAMTDVVPGIVAGLVEPATGGMRLPEFVTEDSQHADALLAGRFTLLALHDITIERSEWHSIDGHVVVAPAETHDWFGRSNASWAIVRPDRYVFALGRDRGELDAALTQLFGQLHLNPIDESAMLPSVEIGVA